MRAQKATSQEQDSHYKIDYEGGAVDTPDCEQKRN